MSLRRLGKCASDGLRPRAAKLSRQIRPCSNSRVPLRIVSRFQPRSRSARRCPPDPSSLTVRAMNNRRALPFSALAVSMNKALNESVNSIVGSPALLSLECMIHHLGWFNFCVSLIRIPSEQCALIAPPPPELVGGASSRMLTLLRSSVPEPIGPRPVLVLLQLLAGGICAGLPMTVPPPAIGVKGHDRASATRAPPFTLAVPQRSLSVIASNWAPHQRQQGAER